MVDIRHSLQTLADAIDESTGTKDGFIDTVETSVARIADALPSAFGKKIDAPEGDPIPGQYLKVGEDGHMTYGPGGGSSGGGGLVSKTSAELKALRDGGKLVPGTSYRITDYICTTTQEGSRVQSHPYDIIVTADSETALSEIARACAHDAASAEYYQHANIGAWELKYSLDNDTNRFKWADAENGHGVVYYLKDDHGNECPYDFKQIQFARYKITECTVSSLVGKYAAKQHGPAITGIDEQNPVWCYTFSYDPESTGAMSDASVMEFNADNGAAVSENIIKTLYDYQDPDGQTGLLITYLNDIVLVGHACHSNMFGNNCRSNTLGYNCYNNTFGNACGSNTFGEGCYFNKLSNTFNANTFGDNCESNEFGDICNSNTFGNYCAYNTFGDNCDSNTFGEGCGSNMFGNSCNSNKFGNYCSSNMFVYGCDYNTFRDQCGSNTFGYNCQSNTFGDYCSSNKFGDNCMSNTFGDNCGSNTFRDQCGSNTFGDGCNSNTFGDYCSSNKFGDGCQSNTFGNGCSYNTFMDGCRSNTFGDGCQSNTFGTGCMSNTFGDGCQSNTFGDNCGSNAFGISCNGNTFKDGCSSNTFGDDCNSNTFGDGCTSNTFGGGCRSNTFRNLCNGNAFRDGCQYNAFGNTCAYNTFMDGCRSNTFGDNCNYNAFGGNCSYIDISAGTGDGAKRYYHVLDGVQGTDSSRISITGTDNNNFVTYVGMNSSGVLKTWTPADLVQ